MPTKTHKRVNAVSLLSEKLSAQGAHDGGSGWVKRHQEALKRPYGVGMAIRMALHGLAIYAEGHFMSYGSPIGEDYVLGVGWLDALKGIRVLLNGELGGLDGGTLDGAIIALATNEGFKEEF